jgi:hypothetical protein
VRELLDALGSDRPLIVHLHGVAGIGKSSLLAGFAAAARDSGAMVIALDGTTMEPTERGLQAGLARALGLRSSGLDRLADRMAEFSQRVVLTIDHYEALRLVDTWLRQVFVPKMPTNVRIVIAGRERPVAGWLTAPELAGAVEVMAIGPLDHDHSIGLLVMSGVSQSTAEGLAKVTRGHPLSLRLAAAAARERPDLSVDEIAAAHVVEELSRLYLADVSDPITRRAIEAASVVRRMTISLLTTMLPDIAPLDAFERLRALPFVEIRQDGLMMHEAVQAALSRFLLASDPVRHREFRHAAWRTLREEVRTAGPDQLWRYTADMLYMIENPVVREAFFPSGAQSLAVEPARAHELAAIDLISRRHDGAGGQALMDAWWANQPDAFSVVRDRDGGVTGFLCVLDQRTMLRPTIDDPVVASWASHLQANPMPHGQLVLGFRRWLDIDHGELPCASQAAAWLDVKRTYMELRPKLRRIYVVVHDPTLYLPIVTKLGFRPLGEEGTVEAGGRSYLSVVLDFGPESVDGWLAGLVADELGIAPDVVVDPSAREIKLNGRQIQLTPLEFGVLNSLQQREGRTVTRATLLEEVWGYRAEVGSNVVDVVVRRLRDKLGSGSMALETVRGSGYRLSVH